MPIGRRVGRPGLIGTAARTAVVVGTAGAVSNRQQQKYAATADAQAQQEAEQAAAQAEQQPAAVAPVAAAPAQDDLIAKLQQLGELHASGILSDAEFTQAKAKLLT